MMPGTRIILGVSGSIAAYKSLYLLRLLQKSGAEVKVVMTPSATKFVGALSFRTLSGFPVFIDLWEDGENLKSAHVQLAEWADLLLIAPATADTLARMATGRCENALDAVYLSSRKKVIVAPAMDHEMYHHAAVQQNLQQLQSQGVIVLPTDTGELASGIQGQGRMQEPEQIWATVQELLQPGLWTGKNVLITAGPTFERLDPVRYIGNFSSGKMGYSIAEAAAQKGANVTLISGPVALPFPSNVKGIQVESAQQMLAEVLTHFPNQDITIMAAAVADFRPAEVANQKIKKANSNPILELVQNPDILKTIGELKQPNQKVVGFALETQQEEENAKQKLASKNLDLIVMNSLNDPGVGFGTDQHKVTLFFKDGRVSATPYVSKKEIAQLILQACDTLL
jgi:phosphopantothenoylcysteine decarboxylase/phosphopantothenate--cysteine ligase